EAGRGKEFETCRLRGANSFLRSSDPSRLRSPVGCPVPHRGCLSEAQGWGPHSPKPPTNPFALEPSLTPFGSVRSLFALLPPTTTSSASSAALSRVTTSATCRRHFFLPNRFSPAFPTYSS